MAQAEVVGLPAAGARPALTLHWQPKDGERRPVVVALHGCGGLYQKDGTTLDRRYRDYTQRWQAQGFHVLLPDSFGSRGERLGICSQRNASRRITVQDRRGDVLAALEWLHQRPEVDPERIALLGWSNGGSTVLAVLDAEREPAPPPLAAAVLFYPGCGQFRHANPRRVPVLMELGGADDWTPPAPCQQLAERWQAGGLPLSLHVHAGAYHGFDSAQPVRFRTDVPNGVKRNGVHQGGNPQAREAAQASLDAFLDQQLLAGPR
jgi:dienelactone hydrolase